MERPVPGKLPDFIANPSPAGIAERFGIWALDHRLPQRGALASGMALLGACGVVTFNGVTGFWGDYQARRIVPTPIAALSPEIKRPEPTPTASDLPISRTGIFYSSSREFYDHAELPAQKLMLHRANSFFNGVDGVNLTIFQNRVEKLLQHTTVGIRVPSGYNETFVFAPFSRRDSSSVSFTQGIVNKYGPIIQGTFGANFYSFDSVSLADEFSDYFQDNPDKINGEFSNFREELSDKLSLRWASVVKFEVNDYKRNGQDGSLSLEAQKIILDNRPIELSSITVGALERLAYDNSR